MSTDLSRKWTRRDWIKAGVLTGAAAGAGGLAGFALYPAFFPSANPQMRPRETLVYTRYGTLDVWWARLIGREVSVADFEEWQGASAVWRGSFEDGKWVPGTGYPVLVIRVKRDLANFQAPTDVPLPAGHTLYFDDSSRDLRILVVFDRSTHRCCYPGWHVVTSPPPGRDYTADSPTYEVHGQDPIYDVCHGGQWDPMVIEWGLNPRNNQAYVGARMVRGPGFGPLPVVAVRAVEDILVAGMINSSWYEYC